MNRRSSPAGLIKVLLLLFVGFLCGCDPTGLLRIQLQLRSTGEKSGEISVDSIDVREALEIVDTTAKRHGYKAAFPEAGYVRLYVLSLPPVMANGQYYQPEAVPCRVKLTATGLFVTFGRSTLVGYVEPESQLFDDVRSAFVIRYGKANVKSRKWGGTKYDAGPVRPDWKAKGDNN
jgi:hypothetical protein